MKLFLMLLVVAVVSSCSTVPNSCGEEGVNCYPVRTVIKKVENRAFTDLNSSPTAPKEIDEFLEEITEVKESSPLIKTVKSGDPLLTMPRQLRLWVNRYEDADGDWNDETFIVLRLDQGRWRIGIDAKSLTR